MGKIELEDGIRKIREGRMDIAGHSIGVFAGIIMAVCLTMTVVNIAMDNAKMAWCAGGLFVWIAVCLVVFFIWKSVKLITLSFSATIVIAMIFFIIDGGKNGYSALWLVLVPLMSMHFLSLYYGAVVSISLAVFTAVYMWSPLHEIGYDYNSTFLVRFPIVLLIETVLCILAQYANWTYEYEQKELLHAAEGANRSKSEFLANMSHEIRTPMNAIMGMCELVLNEEDISSDVRDNCSNIWVSGKNLLEIINDLLDFSKIESGKMELVLEKYNITSMLNDIINMAMARKGDKDIELMVDCDPDIPELLYGDEIRIRQVIVNILTNAIKFTHSGGIMLTVRTRQESYGVNLIIKVEDSGIGIKPENIGKIFNSFSQVDTKKNRAIEGTGLGLTISKRLVKKMGGVINVRSVYGKGTEFNVVIPQKVLNDRPLASIKTETRPKIICYLRMEKYSHPFILNGYKTLIGKIGTKFCEKYEICATLDALKRLLEESPDFTHIFTAREEYIAEKEYFDQLALQYSLIVVQDRNHHIQLPSNVHNVYKPFYSLSIANILNGEKLQFVAGRKKTMEGRFIAPEARILIVDDNTMNLKVAVGLLKPYKMQMETAESGRQAIELIQNNKYHIIFMDHMMPEMDGIETTQEIRKLEGEYFQNVPVIALTANAVSGVREMFISEGFQDFVAKPIEMSAMERVIRKWLPEALIKRAEEGSVE